MVLDKKRSTVDPLVTIIAKRFSHVHPDLLTWSALIFAVIAGLFFYFSSPQNEPMNYFLLLAVLFIFLNGLFDAIDGKVATLAHKESVKGDFLDHALDRYADVFIVGGLALSPWCDPRIGLLALVGMLLTSYMGTQAQAVGYKREYSGLLGRADRLVLLMIFPVLQHISLSFSFTLPFNISLLGWVLIYFAVVGNITAIQRFLLTLKWLKKQ